LQKKRIDNSLTKAYLVKSTIFIGQIVNTIGNEKENNITGKGDYELTDGMPVF